MTNQEQLTGIKNYLNQHKNNFSKEVLRAKLIEGGVIRLMM